MWVGGGPDLPWFDPDCRRQSHRRMGANALSQARMRTVDRLRYHLNKRPSGTNPHNNVCKGLSLQQMITWLRKAKVVDDRHVTRQDVAACFNAHRQPLLTLDALPAFLRSLSQRRHLDSTRLVARLLDESSSMPPRVATAAGLQIVETAKTAQAATIKATPASVPAPGVPTQGVPTRTNPQGLARSWRWPPPRWPPPARWPTSRRGARPRTTSAASKDRMGGGGGVGGVGGGGVGSRSSSITSQRSTCGVTIIPAPTFRRSRSRTPMARCMRGAASRSTLTISSSTRGSEEPLGRVVWSDWSAASSNSRRTRSRSGIRNPPPPLERPGVGVGQHHRPLRTTRASDTKLLRSSSCAAAMAAAAGAVPASQATPAVSAAAAIAAAAAATSSSSAAGARPLSTRAASQKPGQAQTKTSAQGKEKSSSRKASEISSGRSVKSLLHSPDTKSEAGTQTDLPQQEEQRGKNQQHKLKSASSSTEKCFNMIETGTQTLHGKDGLPRKYRNAKQHFGSGTSWHPPSPLEEENVQIAYPIAGTFVSSKMSSHSEERSPSSLSPQQGSYQSLSTSPNSSMPAMPADKSPERNPPLNPVWISDNTSKNKASRRKAGRSGGTKGSPKRASSGKRSRRRRSRNQGDAKEQRGERRKSSSKSKSPPGSGNSSPQRAANGCPLRSYSATITKNKSLVHVKPLATGHFFDSSSGKNPTTDDSEDSPGEEVIKKPSALKTESVIRGTKDIIKHNSEKNVSFSPRFSTSPRRSPTPSPKSSPTLSFRSHNQGQTLSPTRSLITSSSATKNNSGNINRATSMSPPRNSNRKEVKRKSTPQRKRSGKVHKLKSKATQNPLNQSNNLGEKTRSASQTLEKKPDGDDGTTPEQIKSSTKTNTSCGSQKTTQDSSDDTSTIPLIVETPRRIDDNDDSSKEAIRRSLPLFDMEKLVSTTAVGKEDGGAWDDPTANESQSAVVKKMVSDIEGMMILRCQTDVAGQTQTDPSYFSQGIAEEKSEEMILEKKETADAKESKPTLDPKSVTPKRSHSTTAPVRQRSSKTLRRKSKSPPRMVQASTQRSATPVSSRSAPPKLRTNAPPRPASLSPGRTKSRSPPPGRNDSRSPQRHVSQSPPRSSASFASGVVGVCGGGGATRRFTSRSPHPGLGAGVGVGSAAAAAAGRSHSPNAQQRSASPRLVRATGANPSGGAPSPAGGATRNPPRKPSRSPVASSSTARSPLRMATAARYSSSRGAKRLLDARKAAGLTSAAAVALRRGRGIFGRSPGRSPNRSPISARSPFARSPTMRSPARGRLTASPTSVTLHATASKRYGPPNTHKSRTKIASARHPRTSSGIRRNGTLHSVRNSGCAGGSSPSYVKYIPKPSVPASGSPSRLVMLDQKKSRRTRSPRRGRSGRQAALVSTSNTNSAAGGGRLPRPRPAPTSSSAAPSHK